jgi:hypothetical protein
MEFEWTRSLDLDALSAVFERIEASKDDGMDPATVRMFFTLCKAGAFIQADRLIEREEQNRRLRLV